MKVYEHLALLGDYQSNVKLANLTTMRVGGFCRGLYQPDTLENLLEAVSYLKKENIDYKIFGKGSNLLCSEDYYDGIIIKMDAYLAQFSREGMIIIADAGCSITNLAIHCASIGLSGLQFAGGIPGTVGGVIYMNAGAYNHEMSEIIKRVLIIDENQEFRWLTYEQCEFGYRSSIFQRKDWIIVRAELIMEALSSKQIYRIMNNRKKARISTQPLNLPSAGSCFKNPNGLAAWQLIEDAGLRGYRVGGACVSEKHCNFIVNDRCAKAQEVLAVIEHVKNTVKKNSAVDLELEMELFNWHEKEKKTGA